MLNSLIEEKVMTVWPTNSRSLAYENNLVSSGCRLSHGSPAVATPVCRTKKNQMGLENGPRRGCIGQRHIVYYISVDVPSPRVGLSSRRAKSHWHAYAVPHHGTWWNPCCPAGGSNMGRASSDRVNLYNSCAPALHAGFFLLGHHETLFMFLFRFSQDSR